MELEKDEKKAIRIALQKHLDEVIDNEGVINEDVRALAGEARYEDFIRGIIKKLEE